MHKDTWIDVRSPNVLPRLLGVAIATIVVVGGACGGDGPAPSTTIDEPTGTAERSLYGVDLSGLDLPAADPYEDYETYEDDTGQVEIAVPAAWDDVDTSVAERDGVEIPGVWASTDLEALQSGFTVPGAQVDLRSASSQDELLDLLNSDNTTAEQCSGPETSDYDDGLYVGTGELWTDCSEDGAALLELVALRDGDQYVTLEIQMLTDADIDAALAALEGMVAAELDPGSTTDDTEPSGTGQEPTTTRATADEDSLGEVFDLRVGRITVRSTEDFAIATPHGPDDEWRLAQEPSVLDLLFVNEQESADGDTVYFPFIAGPIGYSTLTFENCPGCPPELGQPVEVVEIGVERER